MSARHEWVCQGVFFPTPRHEVEVLAKPSHSKARFSVATVFFSRLVRSARAVSVKDTHDLVRIWVS
jgi:hypothetical protein